MVTRKVIAAGIALGVTLAFGTARGELVLDQPAAKTSAAPAAPVAAVAAPTTVVVSAPITAPVAAPAPVAAAPAPIAQIAAPAVSAAPAMPAVVSTPAVEAEPASTGSDVPRDPTRAELKRRMRMREELKNEDLLQERLETLRLRDENKRTGQILKDDEAAPQPAAATAATAVQVQAISAPVTDRPGEAPKAVDQISTQQSSAAPAAAVAGASTSQEKAKSPLSIGLTASGGSSSMMSTSGYNIEARYSAGLSLNVGVSDNVSVVAGYQYSEYGLKFAPGNSYVDWVNTNPSYFLQSLNSDTHTIKSNVFDIGVRLYVLGRDSSVRPFIGGGGGYSRNYLNYEQQYIDAAQSQGLSNLTKDYQFSQYLGYVEGGLDIQVAKSISIGMSGKYYSVLSASEDQPLNSAALAYGYYPASYFNQVNDPSKAYLGGSVAHQNFYSILANVTFEF